MTIRLAAADIEREVDQRLAKVGRTAKIKGFRPGKVPPKIVRQRYGAQVREEVLSDAIRSSYSRALVQEKLEPAGGPQIEPIEESDDTEFVFRATFEVYPEITLGPVAELNIEVPKVEIADADVDTTIEKVREQRADWRVVERAAATGDRVIIDFNGTIEGEGFPGSTGEEATVLLGAGKVPDEFEAALVGAKADDTPSAKVEFPADYHVAALAGKTADFAITVRRVEEQVLPALDEAFLTALGVGEGGLEELKRGVRANLEQELADRLAAVRRRSALTALLAANPIQAPQALVNDEAARLQAAAMRQSGTDDPAAAPPRESFLALATERTKMLLLVREVIRAEQIEVDRARVDERIAALVRSYDQPQEVERYYRGNREFMSQLESTVLEEQVVDYLLETAKTEEIASSFEAFMGG